MLKLAPLSTFKCKVVITVTTRELVSHSRLHDRKVKAISLILQEGMPLSWYFNFQTFQTSKYKGRMTDKYVRWRTERMGHVISEPSRSAFLFLSKWQSHSSVIPSISPVRLPAWHGRMTVWHEPAGTEITLQFYDHHGTGLLTLVKWMVHFEPFKYRLHTVHFFTA
jgi:hypothetical protein